MKPHVFERILRSGLGRIGQMTDTQARPTTDAAHSRATLTALPALDVPDGMLDGTALLTRQLDFVRRFARA